MTSNTKKEVLRARVIEACTKLLDKGQGGKVYLVILKWSKWVWSLK